MATDQQRDFGKVGPADAVEGAKEQIMNDAVVAVVCVSFRVVDSVTDVVEDISAAHKLDADCPSFTLGQFQMLADHASCILEVSLVGVEDNGLIGSTVVFSHDVDCPAIDGRLVDLLLSINQNSRALFSRSFTKLFKSSSELLGGFRAVD